MGWKQHFLQWIERAEARVDEDGNFQLKDRLLIEAYFHMVLLYLKLDELFWQLEILWYKLDTWLFPLPKSTKDELMHDYYLRIPKRLALRELRFIYQKYHRRLERIDPKQAVAKYSRKKDKEVIKSLLTSMEIMRDEAYDLYWDVRLARQTGD